jgi:Polyketide cyclase / dehydrase and lipid transport
MAQMQQIVEIARPLEEVFAFAADPGNDARWAPTWWRSPISRPARWGVGSRYRYTTRFVGRPFRLVREVTAYEPNRRQLVKTISGLFGGAARAPSRRSPAAPGLPSAVAARPAGSSAWPSRWCCGPRSGRCGMTWPLSSGC